MITVPSQEIAVFLGNHLDQVLQQTAVDFVQSVAANRQFRAGCTLMDILNGVESVNERIRVVLQEQSRGKPSRGGHASEMVMVRITSLYLLYSLYSGLPIQQNPFLCLFMDTYITSLQHDQQRPERFVISVILNGDGEELAPSTPSELVAIAQEVESKPVDLRYLEHLLPDVPIDDQLVSGLGWESVGQQRRGDKKSAWDSLVDTLTGPESLYAMGNDSLDSRATSNTSGDSGLSSGRAEESSTITADNKEAHIGNDGAEEEELEEWEIEAEKHFQDLEDVAPAPAKVNNKPKKPTGTTVNRQQLNAIMEQATTQPLTFDQEQFMLSQFNADTAKVHIPLPPPEALPGIVDNNPTIAFNLLLYLIQLSSDMDGGDLASSGQKPNGSSGSSGKAGDKRSSFSSPEPSIVGPYLETMTRAKRLTLHSLEVVNRLTGATTLSPRFMHEYIENAIRCCELVEDKVGQARVVRMSLLRNGAITIPGYFHALQSFCVQFARVKEVATLFQSLVEYQRKMDGQSPVQAQGPSFRGPSPSQQQQSQQPSRVPTQSASMPSTPTADVPQRSSWLASSGSISNVKSTLSKHTSLNGFSTPGALSQFIHPGPGSPLPGGSSNQQNGGGHSASQSFSNGIGSGNGSHFKTHHKHSSQHSPASGSLFSSPTVMSASVNAFNSGLGNPTSLTLNGSNNSSGSGTQSGNNRSRSSFTASASASGAMSTVDNAYDLDAALRASLKDMETRGGPFSASGATGSGSSTTAGSSRASMNGPQQQQQQQQQTVHLGPKGFSTVSHQGNHARGRGARRGG